MSSHSATPLPYVTYSIRDTQEWLHLVAVGEEEWRDLVAYKLVVLSDEPEDLDGP